MNLQPTKALCNGVRLHISIIVLASPHKATLTLHGLCNHVVDQAMLVPDACSFILALVFTEKKKRYEKSMNKCIMQFKGNNNT